MWLDNQEAFGLQGNSIKRMTLLRRRLIYCHHSPLPLSGSIWQLDPLWTDSVPGTSRFRVVSASFKSDLSLKAIIEKMSVWRRSERLRPAKVQSDDRSQGTITNVSTGTPSKRPSASKQLNGTRSRDDFHTDSWYQREKTCGFPS